VHVALLAQRQRNWGCLLVLPPQTSNVALGRSVLGASGSPDPKELSRKAVAQPHVPMALLAQRHRDWGSILVLPPQTSNVDLRVRAKYLPQPCSKKQTSADSSQAEGAGLESCCSASFTHCTARREAQRLGLHACLATSNFKHRFQGP